MRERGGPKETHLERRLSYPILSATNPGFSRHWLEGWRQRVRYNHSYGGLGGGAGIHKDEVAVVGGQRRVGYKYLQ